MKRFIYLSIVGTIASFILSSTQAVTLVRDLGAERKYGRDPVPPNKQRQSTPDQYECSEYLDTCVITIYMMPPDKGPNPKHPQCYGAFEYPRTRASAKTKVLIWRLVNGLDDGVQYMFHDKAITFEHEDNFEGNDDDDNVKKSYRWRIKKKATNPLITETKYTILVNATVNATVNAKTTPCSQTDPTIANN